MNIEWRPKCVSELWNRGAYYTERRVSGFSSLLKKTISLQMFDFFLLYLMFQPFDLLFNFDPSSTSGQLIALYLLVPVLSV